MMSAFQVVIASALDVLKASEPLSQLLAVSSGDHFLAEVFPLFTDFSPLHSCSVPAPAQWYTLQLSSRSWLNFRNPDKRLFFFCFSAVIMCSLTNGHQNGWWFIWGFCCGGAKTQAEMTWKSTCVGSIKLYLSAASACSGDAFLGHS